MGVVFQWTYKLKENRQQNEETWQQETNQTRKEEDERISTPTIWPA